jgi:hypothetical protein
MRKVLIFAVFLVSTGALASPRLLDTDVREHGGWLLAQADDQVTITTTDGQVVSGTLIEDVAGGMMVRDANGNNVFVERARIKNFAHTLGERATPQPPPGRQEPVIGPPASGRSKDSLKSELTRLLAERPGAGGGITMIALGGLGLIAGLITLTPAVILLNTGYTTNQQVGTGLLVAGLVELVVGAVLLIVGIVVTKEITARRRLYNEKIEDIERELKHIDDVERGRTSMPPPALVPTQLAEFRRGL